MSGPSRARRRAWRSRGHKADALQFVLMSVWRFVWQLCLLSSFKYNAKNRSAPPVSARCTSWISGAAGKPYSDNFTLPGRCNTRSLRSQW